MDEQAMLTRDLVLRLCATATEFDQQWIRSERKIVVPFTAPRDTDLVDAIVAAGRALGVQRLLMCRTSGQYAYEPVTDVAADTDALVDVIRGWGDTPTDFLIAVEDTSAAVLVTATTLTVAAGPEVFVRELVGRDIAAARADFAREAREEHDSDLIRAAHRYDCLELGGRHSRKERGPGPDLAERFTTSIDSLRRNAPRTVSALRTARGMWGWITVALLIPAAVLVPAAPAVLALTVTMLWLLVQLAWLSRSRTVGFAALMRALLAGALVTVPIVAAELALAAAVGLSADSPLAYAYIAVPVEEIGKLAPMVLLWLVARRRFQRFAAVDFLLLAAASGAGFQLAEQALQILPAGAQGLAFTPAQGMFTFLPGGIDVPGAGVHFSGHAVITGLVGAALGLAVVGSRVYGAWLWLLPPLALGAAALEHLAFNAMLAGLQPTTLTAVVFGLYGRGAATVGLLLVLLVVAVVMDYRLTRTAADVTPPLPGRPPLAGLVRRAHTRAVRVRVRIPGDIVPLFRRYGLAWARFPVTLAEAASAMLHEFTLMIVAASRGPATLCRTWRFLRQRREYAMGAARANGRPWRRMPPVAELGAVEEWLSARLGAATGAVAVTTAASLAVVLVPWAAVTATAVTAPPEDGGAYALASLRMAESWFTGLSEGTRTWLWLGTAALVGLLAVGWNVPHAHPSMRHFLREPRANISGFLGALAPGQLPYAIVGVAGMALPASTTRLLKPEERRAPFAPTGP
ncbi:PrsW family glutamic-type intramembrane protease [Salinactinospora qingdaonensis]|uniref:Membrane proteinase PrsW, cleaves anti-sigma factor RsiW, M82 family n=1 Tax=Salinactinospora qingdaonensis TaxID=702744 RepID=A0ABP7GCE4_9ACTN